MTSSARSSDGRLRKRLLNCASICSGSVTSNIRPRENSSTVCFFSSANERPPGLMSAPAPGQKQIFALCRPGSKVRSAINRTSRGSASGCQRSGCPGRRPFIETVLCFRNRRLATTQTITDDYEIFARSRCLAHRIQLARLYSEVGCDGRDKGRLTREGGFRKNAGSSFQIYLKCWSG